MWSHTKKPSQPRSSARAASRATRRGSASSSNGATWIPRAAIYRTGPTASAGSTGPRRAGAAGPARPPPGPRRSARRLDHDGHDDDRAAEERRGRRLLVDRQPHPQRAEDDLEQRDERDLRSRDQPRADRQEREAEADLPGPERGERD